MNEGIRDINSNYFQEHFGSLVSSIASYNIAQTTVIYAKTIKFITAEEKTCKEHTFTLSKPQRNNAKMNAST